MSGHKKNDNVPGNNVPAQTWHSQQRHLATDGASLGVGVGQHSPDSSLQQGTHIGSGIATPSMSGVDLNSIAMGGGALPTLDAATLQQLTLQSQQMNGMNIDLALLGYNALLQQTLGMGANEVQELIFLREALRKLKPSISQTSSNNSNGQGHGSGPSNPLYKTELCRSWEETGTCRYGAKCQFAHSREELHPVHRHPKYKTELCRTFSNTGTCPYGTRCRFIHHNLASGPLPPHLQQQLMNGRGGGVDTGGPPSSASGSASPSITIANDTKNVTAAADNDNVDARDSSTDDVQGATTAATAALQALDLANNDDDDAIQEEQQRQDDDDDDKADGINESNIVVASCPVDGKRD